MCAPPSQGEGLLRFKVEGSKYKAIREARRIPQPYPLASLPLHRRAYCCTPSRHEGEGNCFI